MTFRTSEVLLLCRFARIGFVAVLACCTLACGVNQPETTGKPVIFVSIPPQAYFVERLAGDAYEVSVLLGQGASHEAYEPKPSQMRDLGRAVIYVRSHVPFEDAAWDSIRGANGKMRVADGLEHVAHRRMEAHEGHEHSDIDPHLWLDPNNMKLQARSITESLKAFDPTGAAGYDQRLADVLASLDKLDTEIRGTLEPVRGKAFWVYHPAWGYFADAYGLRQRAIEQGGKELGAQSLAALIDEARRDQVRVVFVDPQFGRRNAEVVAQEIGAKVEVLDPLARDYEDNLRKVAGALKEALS